jgi:GntR family transcriptional repressor for pyruvate dehydrogenase complex
LRPVSRARLYEQLVERLLDYIHTERIKVVDRLPAERELATQLGVSRASVAQALVAFEVQGVIDVRHGDGAVILDVPAERQILAALRARRNRMREVIEAREALEVKLAALAALWCTPEDLEAIDEALSLMAHEVAQGQRGTSTSMPLSLRRRTPGCSPA